jgi:hypothetical protein
MLDGSDKKTITADGVNRIAVGDYLFFAGKNFLSDPYGAVGSNPAQSTQHC